VAWTRKQGSFRCRGAKEIKQLLAAVGAGFGRRFIAASRESFAKPAPTTPDSCSLITDKRSPFPVARSLLLEIDESTAGKLQLLISIDICLPEYRQNYTWYI